MFSSEGVVFYSNRAHRQREREREREQRERGRGERERERDLEALCDVACVSIGFLLEEKEEESERRFNIAIN